MQRVVGRRQKVAQVVFDDIVAISAVEDIGIAAVAAGKKIVRRAAVKPVDRVKAENRVFGVGLGLLDGQAHDIGFGHVGAVGEDKTLDAVEPDHAKDPGVDGLELVRHREPVASGDTAVVNQGDDQVEVVGDALKAQVVGPQRSAELHDVVVVNEDVVVVVFDAVVAVADVEDIQVGLAAAAQDVGATATIEHIDRGCALHQIVAVQRVAGGPGDIQFAPAHAVGKRDLDHLGVGREVATKQARQHTFELVAHGQHVIGADDLDDEVDAVLVGIDLGRLDLRKAQGVVGARAKWRLGIFDDIVAEVLADDINITPEAAEKGLVAGAQVEDVAVARAFDPRRTGLMLDDDFFVDTKDLGYLEQLGVNRHVFVGRDDHLEDKRLGLGASAVAVQVGVDHVQDLAPLFEVRGSRVAARWRALENRLEHRRQLAPRGGQPGVGIGVVADAAEDLGQPALRRQMHRSGAAEEAVMLHQPVHEIDRVVDWRGVAEHAGGVDRRHQNIGLEDDAVSRGAKLRLRRADDFSAHVGVERVVGVLQVVEVERIVAQRKTAGFAVARLVVQRQAQVVRPDKKLALCVADLDRVVCKCAAFEVDRKLLERERRRGDAEGLDTPFVVGCRRLGQDIGQLRPADRRAVGSSDQLAAGE